MKINSLYISAFGGIKDLKLDFSDGFNVIYGNNEDGKSTVMAFIKMMFYGSERGSSQLAKNVRKKYTPWDGRPMAGSIDFEHGGKKYRLEKEFRSSNSTDRATLCDLDFGTRQAVSGDLGAKFLGLGPAAFERSVFIGQFGFPEGDAAAEGEINSKLSNIALTGDESVSFETVNSRLQKAKLALMSKSGRAGEYDKNIKTLAELKVRLENAISTQQSLSSKKVSIIAAEEEIKLLQKNAAELKNRIDSENDLRNAKKLKELLELKAQLDSLNQTLKLQDGSLIDEMYLKKLKFCISKSQTAEEKVKTKSSEIETLEKSIDAGLNPPADASEQNAQALEAEIADLESEKARLSNTLKNLENELYELKICQPKKQNNGKKIAVCLLTTGIAMVALCVVMVLGNLYIPSLIVGILGAGLISFCPISLSKARKDNALLNRTIQKLQEEIFETETNERRFTDGIFSKKIRLEAINTALKSTAAVIEKQQSMLLAARSELELLKAEELREKTTLAELFSRYRKFSNPKEINLCIEEISLKATKQKELKNQINYILKDLGGISYEEAQKKLDAIEKKEPDSFIDFDALKATYEDILSQIADKKSAVATLSAETRFALSHAENPELIKSELAELSAKTVAQKQFCDAADLAMQTLTESFAEVRRSYGSVLEKKATAILNKLTDGKYGNMSISKSFDINVEEADVFGSREIGYLSSGAADQAYLSLRLALSQLICDNGETLPIMLDDALAQYDDARTKTALEFLKDYSENVQIIMFTCHSNISNYAKNLGAKCSSLR